MPATPVATPYPDAAAGDGNTQQGYNPLCWAEDWRGMRDFTKRDAKDLLSIDGDV